MGLLVIQTVNTHIMKFLLLVSALSLASGTKLGAVTCDECKAASQGLVERLTTDASLEEQAGILIATLCPQAPDADACEAGIAKWWAPMAKCLFPEFLGGADVCVRLGGTPWSGTGPVRSALMSSPRSLSSSRTQRLLRRESLTSRASASADSQTTLTTVTTWSLSSSPQPWRFSLES